MKRQCKKFAELTMKLLKMVKLFIGQQAIGMLKVFFRPLKFVKNTIFINRLELKINIICLVDRIINNNTKLYISDMDMD
jgi:hypothetical protein